MQQARLVVFVLALSLPGWAPNVSAQEQTQYPAAAPQGAPPMFSPPVSAPAFEPAPVPSHPHVPTDPAIAGQPAAGNGPLAPGSTRLRLNGSLTTYFGAVSDSGRTGR